MNESLPWPHTSSVTPLWARRSGGKFRDSFIEVGADAETALLFHTCVRACASLVRAFLTFFVDTSAASKIAKGVLIIKTTNTTTFNIASTLYVTPSSTALLHGILTLETQKSRFHVGARDLLRRVTTSGRTPENTRDSIGFLIGIF